MRVALVSTYELGRQPFSIASAVARLAEAGHTVDCLDLAVEPPDPGALASADLIAFSLPMHTATRRTVRLLPRVRQENPSAHLCCFGLYAPANAAYLRSLGAGTILGGEFEDGLVALAQRLAGGSARETQPDQVISTARQRFVVPDRSGLPGLAQYARLVAGPGDQRLAGYTEASRGCKHLCRHCPVVPVYNGRFRIVPREVVLADIDRQVEAGARHITFGDPDFLNGPRHALALLDELHQRFPTLTYDVTVKVEHLLRHAALLPTLKQTGCLFITSAVESLDDAVLARLAKGHTRSDVEAVVRLFEHVGLALAPTFVTFTPWTTPASYFDLLETLVEWNLVEHVAPIQYAIRLLIPAASRLLELPEVRELVAPFDREALAYPWAHPDPRMDALYEAVREIVKTASPHDDRRSVFSRVWQAAQAAAGHGARPPAWCTGFAPQTPIPFISEAWYC